MKHGDGVEVDGLGNTIKHVAQSVESSRYNTINDLPNEILIQVFSNLDPIQLCSVRLVCKHWNYAVLDKSTWIKSFGLKFGTRLTFPSVSNSKLWILEYLYRLQMYKKWKKAIAIHKNYQLLNNEYGLVDYALTNFAQDKLLTFARISGDISMCNLNNGKNQTFIPGNYLLTQITCYAVNWTYLLVGKLHGELYLKNLITSTSSGSNRSSLIKFEDEENSRDDTITGCCLNYHFDKRKESIDCISSSIKGSLKCWNLGGKLIKKVELNEPIITVKSDFKNYIIAQGQKKTFIVHIRTFEVVSIETGMSIEEFENSFVGVDYGDSNVVICYESTIKVVNFKSLGNIRLKEVILPDDVSILKSKFQTVPYNKLHNRDPEIAGSDGLMCANILSDDTVIVWNIRESATQIVPQCTITPIFNKHHPAIPNDRTYATSIALNNSVIAIGGYNGFTNLYNIFTGDFIRECSIKFPKRLSHMYQHIIPIKDIQLNDSPTSSNGIIICGDAIQYFQFGEPKQQPTSTAKKRLNVGSSNKQVVHQNIKDEIDDYENLQEAKRRRELLFAKYNGDKYDDNDDELSIAIAMSESFQNSNGSKAESVDDDEDAQLKLAIELSKSTETEPVVNDDIEQILKLSLIDQ